MAVENNTRTTTLGGVTGAGFVPGVSGNPGGRPKGLARRVRDLVGEDGSAIAEFMYDVMTNERVRMSDRVDAARWLGDRGFGRSVQPVGVEVSQHPILDLNAFSTEDLEAMIAILDRNAPGVAASAHTGEIVVTRGAGAVADRATHRSRGR